jgi:hypothetical protein
VPQGWPRTGKQSQGLLLEAKVFNDTKPANTVHALTNRHKSIHNININIMSPVYKTIKHSTKNIWNFTQSWMCLYCRKNSTKNPMVPQHNTPLPSPQRMQLLTTFTLNTNWHRIKTMAKCICCSCNVRPGCCPLTNKQQNTINSWRYILYTNIN